MLKIFILSLYATFFTACSSSEQESDRQTQIEQPKISKPDKEQNYYIPNPRTSFSIVLSETIPSAFDAEVIDLDAFDTDKTEIDRLHEAGKKVFAYVSVGSWEPYRDDSANFPREIIGKVYPGWEDEKFLNIRALDKLLPLMQKRFDMIKAKGFDGIEPDNIDIYTVDSDGDNGTGFHISLEDTRRYIDLLIKEAHDRNLSIGQKNAPEIVQNYGALFDWALLEDPFYEKYASDFKIYTDQNKAVFTLSYLDNTDKNSFMKQVCPAANELHFTAILKDRDLTQIEIKCPK